MDNLICSGCGVTYYSAAVATMIKRGERCDCGGLLVELEADEDLPTARTSPS